MIMDKIGSFVFIVAFLLLIINVPLGYSKVNAVATVSFTGVVPNIKCDLKNSTIPSFTELDINNNSLLTEEEYGTYDNHPFSIVDFDSNGYISEIELNVYKKRNCLN